MVDGDGANTRCARCGGEFHCGGVAGATDCWCASLPPLTPVPGRGCLCPQCLQDELESLAGEKTA